MRCMSRDRHYQVNEEARKDLKWWYLFLPTFNGTAIMWLIDAEVTDGDMATDACLLGAGGWSHGRYYRTQFPEKLLTRDTNITHLKMWVVIIAVKMWGSRHTGKYIKLSTDNEAISHIINTGRSADLKLQKLLRELTWWLAVYQFRIRSIHLPGRDNKIPDLLSRWHEGATVRQEFYRITKHMNLVRDTCQHDMFELTHEW